MGGLHPAQPHTRATPTRSAGNRDRGASHRCSVDTGRSRLVPRAHPNCYGHHARRRMRVALIHRPVRGGPSRTPQDPTTDLRHLHQHQPRVGSPGRSDPAQATARRQRMGRNRNDRRQQPRCVDSRLQIPTCGTPRGRRTLLAEQAGTRCGKTHTNRARAHRRRVTMSVESTSQSPHGAGDRECRRGRLADVDLRRRPGGRSSDWRGNCPPARRPKLRRAASSILPGRGVVRGRPGRTRMVRVAAA